MTITWGSGGSSLTCHTSMAVVPMRRLIQHYAHWNSQLGMWWPIWWSVQEKGPYCLRWTSSRPTD